MYRFLLLFLLLTGCDTYTENVCKKWNDKDACYRFESAKSACLEMALYTQNSDKDVTACYQKVNDEFMNSNHSNP